jgi:hypothetical protein
MNCTSCGTPLAPDSRFCAKCGASVPPPPPFSGGPAYPPSSPPGPSLRTGGIPPATGLEGIGVLPPPGMVGACIRAAWEIFKREWVILVAMYFVYTILTAGPDWTFNRVLGKDHPLSITIRFGAAVFSMLLYPGFIVAGLKAVRGARVEFTDLFAGFQRLGAVLAWSIVGGILTGVATLLLVLPGIIVALGLSQAGYLVFDRGMGGVDGLRASWKLMTGYRWTFFVLMLALIGINILGFMALCVGYFVTAPLTAIALAVFHEWLRQWNGGTLAAPTDR